MWPVEPASWARPRRWCVRMLGCLGSPPSPPLPHSLSLFPSLSPSLLGIFFLRGAVRHGRGEFRLACWGIATQLSFLLNARWQRPRGPSFLGLPQWSLPAKASPSSAKTRRRLKLRPRRRCGFATFPLVVCCFPVRACSITHVYVGSLALRPVHTGGGCRGGVAWRCRGCGWRHCLGFRQRCYSCRCSRAPGPTQGQGRCH